MQRRTYIIVFFFFSSRRRHTRCSRDWSSDVCSSDLVQALEGGELVEGGLHGAVGVVLVGDRRAPQGHDRVADELESVPPFSNTDRKSTRLNSSHGYISYAVFCLKKKKKKQTQNVDKQRQ